MKSKKRFLILAILIVICLAIGGVFTYSYIQSLKYPTPFLETVTKYSTQYNVEVPLIYAIMKAESNFDSDIVSNAGASGLMQILPTTGKWISDLIDYPSYSDSSLFTPDCNIRFGTYFLSWLMKRPRLYDGTNFDNVIAAYNAGHNTVEGWLNDPQYSGNQKTLSLIPYLETANYVKRVNSYYYEYKKKLG